MDLVLRGNGKTVSVPDEQVPAAFASEQFGFPKGKEIHVVRANGDVGTIPAEDAQEEFEADSRIATPEEVHAAQQEAKYGTTGQQIRTGAEGLARGLSVGLSDQAMLSAARALGANVPELRADIQGRKETNSGTALATEIGGATLPLLLSGGAAAPLEGAEAAGLASRLGSIGRGVGALPRAISSAGTLAEEGAAGLFGQSMLGRGAGAVAAGATEGGLYGAGQVMSESALTDDYDHLGEKLIAGVGHGALIGGAASGVLKAAGESVSAGLTSASERLGGKLRGFAEESAYKAAGATAQDFKKTAAMLGENGIRDTGRAMLDQLPEAMGKPFALATETDIAAGANALKQKYGQQIGDAYKVLDEAGATVGKAPEAILDRVHAEILKPLEGTPFKKSVAAGVRAQIDDFAEKAGISEGRALSFGELHSFRSSLDDEIYKGSSILNPSPIVQELRQVRKVIDEELKTAGAKAARELGIPEWRVQLDAANKAYGTFKTVAKIADNKLLNMQARRFTSPSDYGVGSTVGLGALMHASSLAGGVASAGAALGSSLVHKVMRERGRMVAADALDRFAALGAVKNAADSVDRRINSSMSQFLSRTHVANDAAPASVAILSPKGRESTTAEAYKRRVDEVAKLAAVPEAHAARLAESTGGLASHAPLTAAAVSTTSQRATAFLQSKIPPKHLDPQTITPQFEKPHVSPGDMAKFARYAAAVDKPLSILEDLHHGRLSRESVEAVKFVYPKIYQQIQDTTHKELMTMKTPPSYEQRKQLAILMGMPTDSTLTPAFIASAQKTFQPQQPNQQNAAKPLKLSQIKDLQTPAQRAEGR